jgi:hypothetical protein
MLSSTLSSHHILFHYLSFTVVYHIILFYYLLFTMVYRIICFHYISFVIVIYIIYSAYSDEDEHNPTLLYDVFKELDFGCTPKAWCL